MEAVLAHCKNAFPNVLVKCVIYLSNKKYTQEKSRVQWNRVYWVDCFTTGSRIFSSIGPGLQWPIWQNTSRQRQKQRNGLTERGERKKSPQSRVWWPGVVCGSTAGERWSRGFRVGVRRVWLPQLQVITPNLIFIEWWDLWRWAKKGRRAEEMDEKSVCETLWKLSVHSWPVSSKQCRGPPITTDT